MCFVSCINSDMILTCGHLQLVSFSMHKILHLSFYFFKICSYIECVMFVVWCLGVKTHWSAQTNNLNHRSDQKYSKTPLPFTFAPAAHLLFDPEVPLPSASSCFSRITLRRPLNWQIVHGLSVVYRLVCCNTGGGCNLHTVCLKKCFIQLKLLFLTYP